MFETNFTDTSRSLGLLVPLLNSETPPCKRVGIGIAASGGVFRFDPFELYESGFISNPNISVMGRVGRGKSAFVKSLLWRSAEYGRSFLVLDPKGEYQEFAKVVGAQRVRFELGGAEKLDPFLDLKPSSEARVEVISIVVEIVKATLGRSLDASESLVVEEIVDLELSTASRPTLEHLTTLLVESERLDGTSGSFGAKKQAAMNLLSVLRRLLWGDLSGLLGTSSTSRNLSQRVVVDLSGLVESELFALVVNLILAQRFRSMRDQEISKGFVVLDEAWSVLESRESASRFRSLFKLARSYGSSNLAVTHRLSDLGSTAPQNDRARNALSLAVDSETFVLYGQPPSEIDRVCEFLGLPRHLGERLPNLPKGVALWSVAGKTYFVRHVLHPLEREVIDTDQAMVSSIFAAGDRGV